MVEEADNKTREKQKELDELRSNISNFHININELKLFIKTQKLSDLDEGYRIKLDSLSKQDVEFLIKQKVGVGISLDSSAPT